MRLKSSDLDMYVGKFPIWVVYHADLLREKIAGMEGRKKEELLREECAKLDRFCEILCATGKSHVEAEREVYGNVRAFYSMLERKNRMHQRFVARMEENREKERIMQEKAQEEQEKLAREMQEPDEDFPDEMFYADSDLTHRMREKLAAKYYKRLKTSPFGDSGAAYYWVRTRYNESKEHAFFCHLIEMLVKERADHVVLHVNSGPDVEFEYDERNYCFDVETGKNLARGKGKLERKFLRYKADFFKSFVFITNKRLKYRYAKYAQVVTRATLKETLNAIFRQV